MVFANLPSSEKDAFFGLLDEYFASRPDVFGSNSKPNTQANAPIVNAAVGRAAASALHNAFSSHSDEPSSEPAWKQQRNSNASSPQPPSDSPASAMGRVAAAAAAFKMNPSSNAPPRPPPRKVSGFGSPSRDQDSQDAASDTSPPSSSPPPPPGRVSSTTSKLVSQKKFGDVDMSSGKNMFSTIRHGSANKAITPPAPVIPPAFAPPRSNFAPPPVRRLSSTTSVESAKATPPPPPPRPMQEEPEEEGEWAEALYEYTSEDPNDLELQAGERVLVVERTSDDWWTAIHEGKRGLVPASYIKLL